MKRVTAVIVCGLVAVVLVLAGCSGSGSTADTPTTRTADVTQGNLTLDISAAGNLAFSKTEDIPVDLFYQQGTISDVMVQVGDSVTQGEELATLDPDEWQTNLSNLQDAVTSAQRQIATRQQAVDSANRTIATKEQAVTNAENALATDQSQITARQLAVTQAQLDVTSANNTVNNLKDIKDLQDKIDGIQTDLDTAQMIVTAATTGGIITVDSTQANVILDYNYWNGLVNTLQGELGYYKQKRANLLSGATPMSTSALDTQLEQDQLLLQNKELALSNAQAAVTQAQQALVNDQTAIDYAREDVVTAKQNLGYAQQDLASAQDSYDTAVQNLDDAQAMSPQITAPFDGIVTKVNVAGGDKVQKGTVAVSIADPSRYEASILVSELDILQVKVGDTATVTADAVSGGVFPATVTEISPTATIQSGVVNYGVTVELQAITPITSTSGNTTGAGSAGASDNTTGLPPQLQQAVDNGQITLEQAKQIQQRIASGNFTRPSSTGSSGSGSFTPPAGGFGGGFGGNGGGGFFFNGNDSTSSSGQTQSQLPQSVVTDYQLRQGLTVTVSISIAARTDVVLVPNAAVTTTNGQSYVQVVNASGQTEQRQVETGLSDWQNTEITSGLTAGEQVLVPLNTAPSSSGSSGSTRIGGGVFGIGR